MYCAVADVVLVLGGFEQVAAGKICYHAVDVFWFVISGINRIVFVLLERHLLVVYEQKFHNLFAIESFSFTSLSDTW